MKHHPDRNPGREDEVIADFQRIQSAHEVLTDVQERAKYDAHRMRGATGFRNGYANYSGNYSGGTSSGMKGNPWSNVSSQYPTPPKPPTRARPTPAAPSAGAQRYNAFKPPTTSAYQAAQNQPRSRQDTYEAFDKMKNRKPMGPGNGWAAPQPPPRGTPRSGQEESNARAKVAAEKAEAERVRAETERARSTARPGFNEYRESNSSQHRSPSKGFQPNTPGGDEPPAPRGAYSTSRDKPMAPPPPPRQPQSAFTTFVTPDPLQQFRKDIPSTETRSSQPYNTHGGEKFSLHGSPNMGRSKSQREGNGRFDDTQVPRTGSESNLSSPQRARSSAYRSAKPARQDSTSSDGLRETTRAEFSAASKSSKSASAGHTRKRSSLEINFEKLRKWMAENPGQEPPPNGFPADGPPLQDDQTNTMPNSKTADKMKSAAANGNTNGQPNMYANSAHIPFTSKNGCPTPSVASHSISTAIPSQPSFTARNVPQRDDITEHERTKKVASFLSSLHPGEKVPAEASSELAADLVNLSPFEKAQQDIVNHLITSKRTSSYSQKLPANPVTSKANFPTRCGLQTSVTDSTELKSPSKKSRKQASSVPPFDEARAYWQQNQMSEITTDYGLPSRFSFPIAKDTFTPTQAQTNGYNSSAENISTKFTPEDWDGKFAAGSYFQPTQTAPLRAQSGSSARGRSPSKVRPMVDPKLAPSVEPEILAESPAEIRFSADHWKETFKPQTFMPPTIPQRPGRKRNTASMRSTMGGRAAIVDEDDAPTEKPLFDEPRVASPEVIIPDPMDIDTPPVSRVVPEFMSAQPNGDLNGGPRSPKRPAAPSTPSPVDQEELAVNFDDMKIKGFSLVTDPPPMPPVLLELAAFDSPEARVAFDAYVERFAKYMKQWDAVSKQYLLWFVNRQTYTENMGELRWTEKMITHDYRSKLQEDQAVLQKWAEINRKHQRVVKDFVIMKERMDPRNTQEAAQQAQPQVSRGSRKKVC